MYRGKSVIFVLIKPDLRLFCVSRTFQGFEIPPHVNEYICFREVPGDQPHCFMLLTEPNCQELYRTT